MTDIRLVRNNNGDVLTVVIGDTSYTPEQIGARLAALDRAWDIAHEKRGTAQSKLGRIIEALREAGK